MLFLFFIAGLFIGSFLNVCIYRLPREESILYPPSHCPTCKHPLKPWNLVPLLSYIWQRGRCSHCAGKISLRYPMVELVTGLLFAFCYWRYDSLDYGAAAAIFAAFLLVITYIDYDYQLILDKVLLCLSAAGFIIEIVLVHLDWIDFCVGPLLGGGVLLLLAIISRGGMGGGDVKFAAVLGLWLGIKGVILMLFLAFLLGGFIGIVLLALGRKGRKDAIPFGPFMAVAALITWLYGADLLAWNFGMVL